jgi:hypothetical protein
MAAQSEFRSTFMAPSSLLETGMCNVALRRPQVSSNWAWHVCG